MEINIKLDKRALRKKGYPIILNIYISKNDRLRVSTEYYAFENEWDEEQEMPTKLHPYYSGLYEYILDLKLKIHRVLERKNNLSAQQVKQILMSENPDSLTIFWEKYIENLENNGKKGNAKFYRSCLLAFKNFKSDVLFSEISYDFLMRFRDFHLNKRDKNGNKSVSNNGVIIYLRGIRAVYNDAIKRKLYKPEDPTNPFSGVMPKSEPTKDKYFTIDEMKLILNAENCTSSKKLGHFGINP